MKKKLSVAALLVALLSLISYGTIAFFTAEDTAHNVITSGNINIELLEWADEDRTIPFPKEAVEGVMPGTKVTKIVEVDNTGSNPAFIRVKVDKDIELAKGMEGDPDIGLMQLDFDNECWTHGEDGFYYYKKALAAGETTKPLFASVSFDKTMDNRYQNSTARVNVTAYATQQANNGKKALEAKGWPETNEDD